MRLIDKDLILETAKDKEWGLWCEIVNIKFAPEVKAIPIEWINNWLNKGRNAKYFIPMMELIEEWEKENEQNKESTSQAD